MLKEELVTVLRGAGKPVETLTVPDGGAVLILPYGARILGLFAPAGGENFLWTNPALEKTATAQAFFAGEQWHNSGGDRTWLAPEVDFFFPKFPDMQTYFQPRGLDPGNYRVVSGPDRIELINHLTIKSYRSQNEMELRISKSVLPAANPLRDEHDFADWAQVQYAGYTLHTSLTILRSSPGSKDRVGLWNLLQMPHGGDLLAPTCSRSEPKVYFGQIPPADLLIEDQLLTYKMRAGGGQKIGVRAVAAAGRVGYVYHRGDQWVLLLRNFTVNPSGHYVDVPWDDFTDYGYAIQACNVNTDLGSFSELEYHAPALDARPVGAACQDIAQVWAYRGSREMIQRTIARLLSPLYHISA